MKTFQLIFRGGRVQNLMADQYSRKNNIVSFRSGRNTQEYPAESLIMIDELSDDSLTYPAEEEMLAAV